MRPFPVDPSGGDGQGCARLCAGGTPALPGSRHPMTSSHSGHEIAEAFWFRLSLKEVHLSSCLFVFIRVHSWFVFINDRLFFLERSARQGGGPACLKQQRKRVIHEVTRRTTKFKKRDGSATSAWAAAWQPAAGRIDQEWWEEDLLGARASRPPQSGRSPAPLSRPDRPETTPRLSFRPAGFSRIWGRSASCAPASHPVFVFPNFVVSLSYDPPGRRGPDLPETKPVSLSYDPPRRGGRGPDLPEIDRSPSRGE